MGIEEFLLLLALVFVGMPAAWVIGVLLGRLIGLRWLANVLPLTVLLLAIVAVPIALQRFSVPADASVVERREEIRLTRNGEPRHDFFLLVSFVPEPGEADSPTPDRGRDSVTTNLVATSAVYDSARVGSTIAVRYLPQRPRIAKLSDLTYLDLLAETAHQPGNRIALMLLSLVGVGIALAGWNPKTPGSRGLRRAWLAACFTGLVIVVVWERVSPLFEPPDDPELSAVAEARVLQVSLFTTRQADDEVYELAHPFQVVQVEYTPATLGLPVRAADAIDVGSVPDTVRGATVRVRYAPGSPRVVRIEGATRDFVRGNAWHEGLEWLAIAALCAAVGLLVLRAVRRRRQRERDTNQISLAH